MFNKLENIMLPLATKIGRNKYLMSIRDGFMVSTPLLIAGSVFLLIANFPIDGWLNFLRSTVVNHNLVDINGSPIYAGTLMAYLEKASDSTFSLMAIFAVMGIGYSYAKHIKTSQIFGAAVALMSWFILMPFRVTGNVPLAGAEGGVDVEIGGISMAWVGAKGILIGIICAFVSVSIYAWAERKGWVIKMPEGVPPMVVQSFAALIPAFVVMAIFWFVNLGFGFAGTNVFDLVYKWLQTPILKLGDTLGAMSIAYIFLHIFWFLGVNGGSVVGAVFNPILDTLSLENVEFLKTGVGTPHIINHQFQDLFATFGGAGSTLSLLIAMLLFCKSRRVTELGKLALIPGIFGINEPIVFGLPIVLNPTLLIPFVLVPALNILIAYAAMAAKLVPICSGVNIPWTTPVIISGFLATNWAGAVLQFLLLILGVFIYMPFIKIMDKQYLNEEREAKLAKAAGRGITEEMLSFDDL